MSRILSIDYGVKRTGLAVTDEMQMIATGLKTIETPELFNFLKEYISKERVEKVIIGDPKKMDGTPSESAIFIEQFVKQFTKEFPTLALEKIDERFTSKLAFNAMIDSGLKKKQRQNKGLIDEIAATILLQDYLQYKK